VLAAKYVTLKRAVRVLPVGIAMGLVVMTMVFVTDWRLAIALLMVVGVMGGYFVVPMNALLQHRGHLLMGAGHSIAVQNFNENLSILVLLGVYALMLKGDLSINPSLSPSASSSPRPCTYSPAGTGTIRMRRSEPRRLTAGRR
jgi:hypothetical protein